MLRLKEKHVWCDFLLEQSKHAISSWPLFVLSFSDSCPPYQAISYAALAEDWSSVRRSRSTKRSIYEVTKDIGKKFHLSSAFCLHEKKVKPQKMKFPLFSALRSIHDNLLNARMSKREKRTHFIKALLKLYYKGWLADLDCMHLHNDRHRQEKAI